MAAGRGKATRAVGRYLLVHELGQSYLGPLWAVRVDGAEDGAPLAMLRLLSLARLDADTRVRLLEAAWQAMEVRDDRVCSVTDVVASDGELGIVSDYVEGVTFRGLSSFASVRRKPAPAAVALRVALDLLAAVSALHRTTAELGDEAVPLYGGLSADSVLLAADGRTLVLDVAVTSAASTIQTLGGNPERAAYAAPEQLRSPPVTDARTDIFAVGVLLWELLACRRLFVGSDKAVAQKVLSSKIPRPDELRRKGDPEMPSALVAAVMKALEREPGARPQSAEEFAALLAESGVVPAETSEVALYVTTLAEGALQRARDAVRAPGSSTLSPLGRATTGRAPPVASEARSPAPKPGALLSDSARVEGRTTLPSRVARAPTARPHQATMIGIPPPAVRALPVAEHEAKAVVAVTMDPSEEEPTTQFSSRDLLRHVETIGQTTAPSKQDLPDPPTMPTLSNAANLAQPLAQPVEGGWLDDPASLPPPPLVDREAESLAELAHLPDLAPFSEPPTVREAAPPSPIEKMGAASPTAPTSAHVPARAAASVSLPPAAPLPPSPAYLPSQLPPPLIHDPRARGGSARRAPALVPPAPKQTSQGLIVGVALSLGLVVMSAVVATHVLRGRRDENPVREVVSAGTPPLPPPPVVAAAAEPTASPQLDAGIVPSANSATVLPLPSLGTEAPLTRVHPNNPKAPTAKKKRRYVPDGI